MSTNYFDYYDGSKMFTFLSNRIGLPIDLVNFLVAQIAALCLARLFRKPLRCASPEFRHSMCLTLGLMMGYFCFGNLFWLIFEMAGPVLTGLFFRIYLLMSALGPSMRHRTGSGTEFRMIPGSESVCPVRSYVTQTNTQAIHLSMLPMMCYIFLKTVPPHIMGNVVLTVSMLYLSCLHLHRQIYHTADYTLDITGPLMVITQRVTSLAYSLQDNLSRKGKNYKKHSNSSALSTIEKMPSPLEYFAYTLAFQTLMCGPVIFYSDYINFIEGTPQELDEKEKSTNSMPSPRRAVFIKVAGSIAAAVLYLSLAKKYPLTLLEELTDPTSDVSRSWSAVYLLWYAYLATLVVRCKYYHAWLLSEAICNNSGMGFNGYDKDGKPKWDKMSNIDVFGFEFAQNFRTAVASWNKNTNAWLRGVAYERGGAAWRTPRVYALSAVWHGFHPGYYLTFCAGGLFTVAAKRVRAVARPMFLGSRTKKLFYDTLTFATTRIAMTYATVPFVLLHLGPSLAFYGKLYYSLHFIALGALLLPAKTSQSTVTTPELPHFASKLKNAESNGKSNGKMS